MITIKINASDQKAIFLNHREMTKSINNKYIENNQTFHLQPQLFAYKPKLQTKSDFICSKKRKRKADVSPEITELKKTCTSLISKLKESIKNFEQDHEDCNSFARHWEEPTAFPQFHGANERNDFQIFTFENRDYLIPPHCRFFNHNLLNLNELSSLEKYDFVVIDPPWRNKYIRRIKKAKQELGYKMLDNDLLGDINLSSLIHSDSLVVIWCTNSKQHQQRMLEEFFPRWDLKLIHKITWLKLNTEGNLISDINDEGKKQPFEVLFVACHCNTAKDFKEIRKLEFILSVPSVIHSHKPPIIDLFRDLLPKNPKSVELFARYLQSDFTSIGLEVLKLMDTRLYIKNY